MCRVASFVAKPNILFGLNAIQSGQAPHDPKRPLPVRSNGDPSPKHLAKDVRAAALADGVGRPQPGPTAAAP